MPLNTWPSKEQPREKLLTRGPNALSDAELIAIFLRTGSRGQTAVSLASKLLTTYDGLRNLLLASPHELCKHTGVGQVKYIQLQAALELGRRYALTRLESRDVLKNSLQTRFYLQTQLAKHQHEVFACLFLDNHNRIIIYEELFFGTINYTSVHPRVVVRQALHHNAAAIVLAHNHPSGIVDPSDSDKTITEQLQKALALIDVKILDHIITSGNKSASFLELGLL